MVSVSVSFGAWSWRCMLCRASSRSKDIHLEIRYNCKFCTDSRHYLIRLPKLTVWTEERWSRVHRKFEY